MKRIIFLGVILFLSVVSMQHAIGQSSEKPFELGIIQQINSQILHEKRTLNIYLPGGYKQQDTAKYPVIYLLDGSANEDFIHIAGLVQFYTMTGLMPKTILIGIANVDRRRDFTYPTTIKKDKQAYPTTGGSARFIDFLQQELIPYVNRTFPVNDQRTIIGQSLGGLVSTEILLKRPTMFNNYIIVSPSLWWDNESLLTKAQEELQQLPQTAMHVYLTVGTEPIPMEADAQRLDTLLIQYGKRNLQVFFDPLPNEDHLTILHEAVYRAFNKLFAIRNK